MLLSEELRHKIEECFGQSIRYPKDCVALAAHISHVTKSSVSPSTIKRLFGLIKTTNRPHSATLDLIARYLDYTDWKELNDQLTNSSSGEGIQNIKIPSPTKNSNNGSQPNKERKYARLKVEIFVGLAGIVLLWGIYFMVTRHSNYKWEQLAPIPEVRSGGGIVNNNGNLFYVGGIDAMVLRNNNWMYNPKENSWIEKALMPTARAEFGCALAGDKIYCFGGWLGNNKGMTDIAEVYDIKGNTWKYLPKLPHKITSVLAVSADNQIYILGGTVPGEIKNYFFSYNTIQQTYDSLPPFKVPRLHFSLLFVKDRILAIGGISFFKGENKWNDELSGYDPATNVWTELARLPTAISDNCAVLIGEEVHLLGGSDGPREVPRGLKDIHYIYNPKLDSWRIEQPLPFKIADHQGINFNDKIVLIGGFNNFPNPTKKVYIEK